VTPAPLRGNGYAGACVAAATADAIAGPGRSCVLNTDLANPTSNALYQRLGYRQVAEALDLTLG
jgi:predicted GNAT family acetyltransferase